MVADLTTIPETVEPPKFKRPAHRRSKYTPAKVNAICRRLARGESLLRITKDRIYPSYDAVQEWLTKHEEFRRKYARAREAQSDYYAQEQIDLSDQASPEMVQVVKLQMDARKWYASKLKPKVYGDKGTDINVSTSVQNNTFILSDSKRQELIQRQQQALPA